MGIEQVKQVQLNRVIKAISKRGPLTWRQARFEMSNGYDGWNSYLNNRIIQEWLIEGKLKEIELPDGDSMISA